MGTSFKISAVAGAGITLLADALSSGIMFFLGLVFRSGDGEIAVFEIRLDIFLLISRKRWKQ